MPQESTLRNPWEDESTPPPSISAKGVIITEKNPWEEDEPGTVSGDESKKSINWGEEAMGLLKGIFINTPEAMYETAKRVVKGPQTPDEWAAAVAVGPGGNLIGPLALDLAKSHIETFEKGLEQGANRNYAKAAAYGAAAAVPGIGPLVASKVDKATGSEGLTPQSGDVGEAAGEVVGALVAPKVVSATARGARAVGTVARSASYPGVGRAIVEVLPRGKEMLKLADTYRTAKEFGNRPPSTLDERIAADAAAKAQRIRLREESEARFQEQKRVAAAERASQGEKAGAARKQVSAQEEKQAAASRQTKAEKDRIAAEKLTADRLEAARVRDEINRLRAGSQANFEQYRSARKQAAKERRMSEAESQASPKPTTATEPTPDIPKPTLEEFKEQRAAEKAAAPKRTVPEEPLTEFGKRHREAYLAKKADETGDFRKLDELNLGNPYESSARAVKLQKMTAQFTREKLTAQRIKNYTPSERTKFETRAGVKPGSETTWEDFISDMSKTEKAFAPGFSKGPSLENPTIPEPKVVRGMNGRFQSVKKMNEDMGKSLRDMMSKKKDK